MALILGIRASGLNPLGHRSRLLSCVVHAYTGGMQQSALVDSTVDQVENALIPLVRYLSSPRTWRQIAGSAEIPLDRARYVVLRAVAESEPVRTTALAEQVGVDPSTMSRHVTVLDPGGLRHPHRRSRRRPRPGGRPHPRRSRGDGDGALRSPRPHLRRARRMGRRRPHAPRRAARPSRRRLPPRGA